MTRTPKKPMDAAATTSIENQSRSRISKIVAPKHSGAEQFTTVPPHAAHIFGGDA